MTMSERDRRALILGGVGLGAVALYLLAIEPALLRYNQLVVDHRRNSAQTNKINLENKQAKYYADRITEWEEQVCELSEPKSLSVQVTKLREQIISAAKSSGAKLKGSTSVTETTWDADQRLRKILMRLEAEAGWEDAFKFVDALYKIENVISVEELDLKGDEKSGGRLTVTLTLSVLAKPDSEAQKTWAS